MLVNDAPTPRATISTLALMKIRSLRAIMEGGGGALSRCGLRTGEVYLEVRGVTQISKSQAQIRERVKWLNPYAKSMRQSKNLVPKEGFNRTAKGDTST